MITNFILLQCFIFLSSQSCVMRGKASEKKAFAYNGPAMPIKVESIPIFEEYCSSLLPPEYKKGDIPVACCADDQLLDFETGFTSLKKIVPDCPICRENIQRLTCNIVCHVNQSLFVVPHYTDSDTKVDKLNFDVDYQFAEGTYNACKDTQFPNLNIPAISFFCGISADKCDPVKLITYLMAQSALKLVPNVINASDPLKPSKTTLVNPGFLRCNESYKAPIKNIKRCGCQDCLPTCPAPPDIPHPQERLFHSFTRFQFFIICLYAGFVIVFTIVILVQIVKKRNGVVLYDSSSQDGASADAAPYVRITDEEEPMLGIRSASGNYLQVRIQTGIQHMFRRWGSFVAKNKTVFMVLPIILIVSLSCGLVYHMELTSDPIDLWSTPHSVMREQKEFFDTNFGPFYRTEQIIIKTPNLNSTTHEMDSETVVFGPPLTKEVITDIFKLQQQILDIKADIPGDATKKVTLSDICFKPLSPYNEECSIFSITQYFQNKVELFNTIDGDANWMSHVYYCINSPSSPKDEALKEIPCLSTFGAPITPNLIYGGYDKNASEANVLVITYIVENHVKKELNIPAIAWERDLIKLLKSYKNENITISYSTEISIHDELDVQSYKETTTVALSYLVMFLYVSLSLGRWNFDNFNSFLIGQKIFIGFVGVLLVFLSVTASLGLFSYLKYQLNMIILEVLPFLALAIGVDNIFLMVHEYRRIQALADTDASVVAMVGDMMAHVGHGMLLSVVAQILTFLIGSVSSIPAVKSFTIFAATTIAINFILQITIFLALFALDCLREKSNRCDVLCCISFPDTQVDHQRTSVTERLFEGLSVLVLSKAVKPLILFLFISAWFGGILVIPSLSVGLEQTIALPLDSHLQKYFDDVFSSLKIGPPTYFVVKPGYEYEKLKQRNLICSGADCNDSSLTNIIFKYSRVSNYSKIATPASSWVDTYLAWLRPNGYQTCCRYKLDEKTKAKKFCPSYSSETAKDCKPCIEGTYEDYSFSERDFAEYLPWFLSDIPVEACPLGGKPSYGKLVDLNPEYYNNNNMTVHPVLTSAFMTYHTPMASSNDLISALYQATSVSEMITKSLNHSVFAYSSFYIFYESYFTIWKEAALCFGLSLCVVFFLNVLVYGFDVKMTLIMTFLVYLMNVVNVGLMYLLNINLNPVSLINLIMFVGINVEFVSHIGRAYLCANSNSRTEKAKIALIQTGSSVFSGIALTKILGIGVLSFSSSLLFRIYYFQMYACAILVGALHGLVLLPVMLSYFGPSSASSTHHDSSALLDEVQ